LNVHNTRNMIGNAANKTESAPDNTTTEEGNTAESHEEL